MVCGFCGKSGHNKRTCQAFNAAEIARMLAEGAALDTVYAACGPFGAAASVMHKAYNVVKTYNGYKKMSITERQRAILGIAVDAT